MIEAYIAGGIFIAASLGSAIVWGVRLEGRVNGHDKANEAHTREHAEIKLAVKEVDRKMEDLIDYLLRTKYDKSQG